MSNVHYDISNTINSEHAISLHVQHLSCCPSCMFSGLHYQSLSTSFCRPLSSSHTYKIPSCQMSNSFDTYID